MIKRVSANMPSFKTVEFTPGFNVIFADRTKESTKKDSRNGLGKSTLIEIIHFCLGAKATKGKGLLVDPLRGWEFSLSLEANENEFVVTRCVDQKSLFFVDNALPSWPISPSIKDGSATFTAKEWNSLLGLLWFGLPINVDQAKYKPTFRSLISYFIRRDKDAFSLPFENNRKQKEWDKQINNAFLLGLAWEDASAIQELKDQKKGLADFRNAVKSGVVKGFIGTQGDLEAQKVRLKKLASDQERELASFKVHPQYLNIREEANSLTEEIHRLANANIMDQRMLSLYEKSVLEEEPPEEDSLERLYREAGVALPGVTLRRINEVKNFHKKVIKNRRVFLATEIGRLKRSISRRDDEIKVGSEQRANLMEVLSSHGALEEYTALQSRHMDFINNLNTVDDMIKNHKAFEDGLSELKIAQEELNQRARRDYEERAAVRERAIEIFNGYSERLYKAPGKLVIDIGPNGFSFDVKIERSGSSGISNMKVFCYDLMLARLWSECRSPRLLIHDSTIFDGVDERQRAEALEMAADESEKHGFQYICSLNSDYVPYKEFSRVFDLERFIRVRLTDASEEGCLLGIRF